MLTGGGQGILNNINNNGNDSGRFKSSSRITNKDNSILLNITKNRKNLIGSGGGGSQDLA